ncbi:MAG TPA: DUF2851 family protein, partial [Verrucomicrobiae bacterium]|nr:DUF2851 family protein [Verrucomicrobiae bacterium]
EIAAWLGIGEGEPVGMAGRCAGPLKDLPAETREDLLRQAAQVRLQRKAAQFVARARQAGWEQALWEGLFAALGYKHNAWPMRCLAELIPRLENETAAPEPLARWQSRLLGLSGLLPFEWERSAGTNDYWRALWDIWWREREELAAALLPGNLWRLHGIRPANHPQRRLALAAAWIARDDLPDQLERWLDQSAGEKEQAETLLKVLNMPAGEFWASHWTFRSRPMPAPQPLLGVQRVTDLAVNVVLPWFWSRAMAGKNDAVRQRVERAYFSWPAGEDNAVLKLARHRLLGGVTAKLPKTAAIQQGLIQITRDFCDHADATCAGCRFPELVRQIGG